METVFLQLANRLSRQLGRGPVTSVSPVPMEGDEQSYSGAKLLRLRCVLPGGESCSYICKYAGLPERFVMQTLTEQGKGHSPAACADLGNTAQTAWFLMEDVRSGEAPPCGLPAWKRQVAAALADIHADNLGAAPGTSPLPFADETYWKEITTKISVDHFERKCASDNQFAREFSPVLSKLRKAAERFAADMTALSRDGTSVTLTHGDLQDSAGDHVRCFRGRPMVIDWGFSRLAPFYIDLVDYFTPEEALLYWRELQRLGVPLRQRAFEEGYRAASLYPVFVYLYPALAQYGRGDKRKLERLLDLLSSRGPH